MNITFKVIFGFLELMDFDLENEGFGLCLFGIINKKKKEG